MQSKWIGFVFVLITSFWATFAFADGSLPKILFDQGHNQHFLISEKGELQLSGLAEVMREKGAVVTATSEPLNDDALQGVAALVISGPFKSLQAAEVEAVTRFLERGGRLAVMLHIGPPLAGLLDLLDVDHSNAVLHEKISVIDKDINFHVKGLDAHPLFADLTQFSLYGGWALKAGKNGVGVARTSAEAWVDLDGDKTLSNNDAVGAFDVVVVGSFGAGNFVIFGDDAIFQNRFLDKDNGQLAANLAEWLIKR